MDTNETPVKLLSIFFMYLSLALFSLRNIMLTTGTIGYRMDHWIPYFPEQIFHRMWITIFNHWIPESLGVFTTVSPGYSTRLLIAGLSLLGLGGDPISKGYFVFFISLSGASVYYLSRTLKLSTFPAFLSGVFYMFTPFLFNFITAGGYHSASSYALIPLALAFFLKLTQRSRNSLKSLLILYLFLALLADYPQYFFVFLIFVLGYAILDILSRRRVENGILYGKILLSAFIIFILTQCAWLLPFIMEFPSSLQTAVAERAGALYTPSRFVEFSPGLVWTFGLRGLLGNICEYFTWTITNSPLSAPWTVASFSFVAIAFSSLILKPKDKMVMYFALMAVLGLFLAKGAKPPAEFINLWIFQNIPIFGITFRDPYHFTPLSALPIAVLIGITIDIAVGSHVSVSLRDLHFKAVLPQKNKKIRLLAKPLACICISLLMVTYALPYLTPSFEDNLQVYNLDQNYHRLYHDFVDDKEDYRILMLPLVEPIVPPGGRYWGTDPMTGEFGKPGLISRIAGSNEPEKLMLFLGNTLYSQSAPQTNHLGKLLGLINVKYIVLRKDFHSYYPPYSSNEAALDVLGRQSDIIFRKNYGDSISVYTNLNFSSHIYSAETSTLAVGDLSSLLDLSGKAIFFPDQQPPNSLPPSVVNKIMIQDANYFDYLISFLPEQYKFNPTSYASKHIKDTGWISLDIFSPPIDWYQSAATENSIVTTVSDTLLIPVDSSKYLEYEVWMKVLLNPISLSFKLDQSRLTIESGFVPLYNESQAMQFVPTKDDLAKLSTYFRRWGDPSEDLTGEIREDDGDTPKGRTIAIFSLSKEKVPEYGIWFDIVPNVRVDPGKKYWIVVNRAGSDNDNTYGWAWDEEAPAKSAHSPDGIEWEVRDTGSFGYETYYSDEPLSLETTIDGHKLKKISTHNTDVGRFEWINLGSLALSEGKHDLKIISNGGEIIISNIVIVPQSGLGEAMQKAKEYAADKNMLFLFRLDKFNDPSGALSTPGLLSYIDHTAEAYRYPSGKITNVTKQLEVSTPFGGEYQFSVEAMSNSDDLKLIIYYDESATEIKLNSTEGGFKRFISKKVYLNEGTHKMNLAISTNYGGSQVTLRSFKVEYQAPETNTSTPNISVDKIDPTKYILHVESSTPFLVIFSEKYDPHWEASHNGQIFDHYKVNFFANAFWIEKTGSFDVIIQFTTQKLYQMGLMISFFTLAFLIALPIVPTRYIERSLSTIARSTKKITTRAHR